MQSWTDTLNLSIKSNVGNPLADRSSQDSVYSAQDGPGLFARNLCDGIQDDDVTKYGQSDKPFRENFEALPASFLHNSIVTPNKVYPYNTNLWDGRKSVVGENWNVATLCAINYNVDAVINNISTARSSAWQSGVLYPHDSNSVDQRSYTYYDYQPDPTSKKLQYPTGFKVPGYYYYYDNTSKKWTWKQDQLLFPDEGSNSYWQNGAGSVEIGLPLGNPEATQEFLKGTALDKAEVETSFIKGALGAGFHVNTNYGGSLKKAQDWSIGKENVVEVVESNFNNKVNTGLWRTDKNEWHGETNYYWKQGENKYWDDFWKVYLNYISGATNQPKIDNTTFNQGFIDDVVPWVSTPKDLINIQNMLYENKENMFATEISINDDWYWGWNEIPTRQSSWQRTSYQGLAFIVNHNVNGQIIDTVDKLNSLIKNDESWKKMLTDQLQNYKNLLDDSKDRNTTHLPGNQHISFGLTIQNSSGNYYTQFVTPDSFEVQLDTGKVKIENDYLSYESSSEKIIHDDKVVITFNASEVVNKKSIGSAILNFDIENKGGLIKSVKYIDESLKAAKADYANIAGLYPILDDIGSVRDIYDANDNGDYNDTIDPSHSGYYVTALSQWQNATGIKSGSNTVYDSITGVSNNPMNMLNQEDRYAPLLVVNGGELYTGEGDMSAIYTDVIKMNPLNNRKLNTSSGVVTYFAFKEANPDGMNHLMQMENGALGWEDMDRGSGNAINSDNDFNDSILHYEII